MLRTRALPPDPHAVELAILEDLARQRWGPTGFRCPRCAHTACWRSRTRPRVRQCRNCRYSTSVTSGTLLHGTRLPLQAWVERGLCFEGCERIPSCSELSYDLGIARSTAWLLNQKLFALAESCSSTPAEATAFFLVSIRVRRPRPTPPMNEAAPRFVQILHQRHREGWLRRVAVDIALRLDHQTGWAERVALSREEVDERRQAPPNRHQMHDNASLSRWLRVQLERAPHTVSLRWLPRWFHAVMVLWRAGRVNPPRWDRAAIRCGPRPLRTLNPWGRTA